MTSRSKEATSQLFLIGREHRMDKGVITIIHHQSPHRNYLLVLGNNPSTHLVSPT